MTAINPPVIAHKAGAPLSAQSEVQVIQYATTAATAGTFTATVTLPGGGTATTAAIAFNATIPALVAAINTAAGATVVSGTANTSAFLVVGTIGQQAFLTLVGYSAATALITINSAGLTGGTLTVGRMLAYQAGEYGGYDLVRDTTNSDTYENQGTPTAPIWRLLGGTPLRGGNTIIVDGDSQTYQNAIDYGTQNLVPTAQAFSVAMVAGTDGALRLLRVVATNGATTADALEQFPYKVLPYAPAYYFVQIGINDQVAATATSEAAAVALAMTNIAALMRLCLDNGIQPIITVLIPNSQVTVTTGYGSVANRHSYIARFNAALKQLVAGFSRPIILLDAHALMGDGTGAFNAAYTTDLLHPNLLGAGVMGNFYAAELSKVIGAGSEQGWLMDTIDQGPNAVTNGQLAPAGVGVPTSWTAYGATSVNHVVATPHNEPGFMWKSIPAGLSVAGIFQDVPNTAGLGWSAGDHMLFAGRIMSNGMTASGGTLSALCYCYTTPGTGQLYTVQPIAGPANLDFFLGRWAEEFVVPSGCTSMRIFLQAGGNAVAWMGMMQITLVNLTALGQATAFPLTDPRH